MKVLVARTAGFCWGVKRAMDAVLEASARNPGEVQTLGPLIHNPQALELIGRRGVKVLEGPEDAKAGTIVVRAHGIPVQQLRNLKTQHEKGNLRLVNATCPEVAKVHAKIKKWSPKGYYTIILGSKGHAESVAHMSFAESGSCIVQNLEEARAVPDALMDKVLVVAQTTFTRADFFELADHFKGRARELVVENTICPDTTTRQEEAGRLSMLADRVVVVGGKNSANTRHLAELATRAGKPVQFVETAAELDLDTIHGHETVAVLAGASTPTWLVDEVVDVLGQHGRSARTLLNFFSPWFLRFLLLSLGAGLMALGAQAWMGLQSTKSYILIVFGYSLSMYLLGPFLDPLGLGSKGPARERYLRRHRNILITLATLSLLCTLILSARLGWSYLVSMAGASVLGLLYKVQFTFGGKKVAIRSIPGSKDTLIALAFAVVSLVLPSLHEGVAWGPRAWGAFLLVMALVMSRTIVVGVQEMQKDQILGKDSLPILLGRRPARLLMVSLLAVAFLANAILALGGPRPALAILILLACTAWPPVYLWVFYDRFATGKAALDPGPEPAIFLVGLLGLI